MQVELKILDPRIGTVWPILEYATEGSAALDLRVMLDEETILNPGETRIVPSGIAIHLNDRGVAALILPRSGLGSKDGIVLGNLVGLIDSDYSKGIGIPVWNRSEHPFVLCPGDRVCQMMFVPVLRATLVQVDEFTAPTDRGGFGHSGVR